MPGLRLGEAVAEAVGGFRDSAFVGIQASSIFPSPSLGQDLPLENALSLEKPEGARRHECSQAPY